MTDHDDARESERDDLRASLETAFGDEQPAEDVSEPEAEPAPEPEAADEAPSEGAERDENGRFKAKEDGDQAEPNDADNADKPAGEIKAPASWSKEDKEAFYSLPDEAQRVIARREHERERHFTQRNQEIAERGKQFDALDKVLSPIRPRLEQHGVSEADYVGRLMRADAMLQRNPAEAIKALAQGAGVDLQQLVGGQQADGYTDPTVDAIRRENAEMKQRLQSLEGAWGGFSQRQAQEQQSALMGQIEAFASATDDSGNPKHPHFDQVREDMALFLGNGRAESLDQAYDMAVYANPQIRTAIQEDHAAREAAKRKAEAEKKKQAAASVTGSPSMGANPGDAPPDDLRAQLEQLVSARI